MQYNVAIVDDHSLIAEALAEIIDNFKSYHVLYTAANGSVLIERFRQIKNIPDIVLLDINMPVMDGFETAKWLTKNHPTVMILALSMQDDESTLIKMIKSGARGYLLKNIHRVELETALDALITKGYYYPDWATSKVLSSLAKDDGSENTSIKFNDRELEFLQLAATELTYKEMAEKMFCSPRTVESYRDSLFEKLGLKTRVGLVVYAVKNGIIKL
jgi:DNA-binding NarL/FixJ family response regulator